MMDVRSPDRIENKLSVALFVCALLFHAWGASVGWGSLNLPGCEFRQTQTAISAHFIQQENNFSLAYPTPVLGKPWSIPMEFPLYQWTVVGLSNVSGLSLTQAGRTVSLACFYLTLPALYLLLARFGLPPARRLVALTLVLVCPLYIFYSRAFLIETMAWMFGCWFLLAFVHAVERSSRSWWSVAAIGGIGAGLIKVTTFINFLLPAFAWTLVWFARDWRGARGSIRWKILAGRAAWAGSAVLLPGVAASWWVAYSDRIKAQSPTGAFLQSSGLATYNFGVGVRFDPAIWNQHWAVLFNEIASGPVLIVGAFIALFFARRWWGLIAALIGFFLAVQVLFPILYAWHEYYYVANAMMLMLALGLALGGLLESKLPRLIVWTLIVGLAAGQAWGYLSHHYPGQRNYSPGGSPLTAALRAVTEPDDVLVIAGNDWSSITPYFAQRRAFMIRRNLERTWDLIHPAFQALEGEAVTALVLHGEQRENRSLIELASQKFGLDPRPVFTWDDAAVFLHEQIRIEAIPILRDIPGIALAPDLSGQEESNLRREVELAGLLPRFRARFSAMTPVPWKYYSMFGTQPFEFEGRRYLSAHPDTKLWFKAEAGERSLSVEWLLLPVAYSEVTWADRSDGVELVVSLRGRDGEVRVVASRHLNPRDNPADRGLQRSEVSFSLSEEGEVEIAILPGPAGNYARDWALLGEIHLD